MKNYMEIKRYDVFMVTYSEASSLHKWRLSLASSTIFAEKFRNDIFLRDCYGNIWPVKVEIVDGGICFTGGWKVFVKHNYLEDGDMVAFRNTGSDVFDVKIYGRDKLDKKGIGRLIYMGKPTVPINEFKVDTRYESYLRRAKVDEHHYASRRKEKMVDPLHDDFLTSRTPKTFPKSYLGRGDKVQYHAPNHAFSGRIKLVDPFGCEFFKSHPEQKPKNPHFITRWRMERVNTLIVPKKIVKKYKLDLPRKMILKDCEGRNWEVTLSNWKDGRQKYGGGLRHLCQVNSVEPEDLLICEFLKTKKKGLHSIRVHIFRQ